jgi:hypothetical protein
VERQVDRLIGLERCLRDPARKTHVTNLADEVLDIRRLDEAVGARRRHPSWGGKKFLALLHKRHPRWILPGRSTACDILSRHDLVPTRRTAGVSAMRASRRVRSSP